MLLKVLREKAPEYLAVAFDSKGKTLRHQTFEAYKMHRPAMPDGLSVQLPLIHRLVEAFRIPVLMMEGYEADDILATLAKHGADRGFEVTVVTGDKDILQMVGPSIRIYDSMKDQVLGEEEVRDRYGVYPCKMVEIMGLMGDPSDNIPGVPGVGEKTAVSLIREFGSIDALQASLDRVKKPKLKENLKTHMDLALLSRQLATLQVDLPLELDFNRLKIREPNHEALADLFRQLEFFNLLREIAPPSLLRSDAYHIIQEETQFPDLMAKLREVDALSLHLETDSDEPMRAGIMGMALSPHPGEAYYMPLANPRSTPGEELDQASIWKHLRPIIEETRQEKYGHNLKSCLLTLRRAGLHPAGMTFDTMVASYLLNPYKSNPTLEDMALDHLNLKLPAGEGGTARKGKEADLARAGLAEAALAPCSRADAILRLVDILRPRLQEEDLEPLFSEIEMPLVEVLAEIEANGFRVDGRMLQEMAQQLEGELGKIAGRIFDLAKGEFNINSPKQLSEVLFHRLGLTPIRRTKTGFSTEVDVLEQLAQQHPLPAEVLQYRSLAKLKSTYVDVLPKLIHPDTGRIHTSLNQTVTATGRLSSSEPNLQNIPVRTEIGGRIREAFIPEEEHMLLSADYSQIELRILAHLSEDEALVKHFQRGEDIHARTAAQIWNVSPDLVTPQMRRMAKTINFGIIYGMSPYGLAGELGVSQAEARRYIEDYFSYYRGVKAFIERLLEEVRDLGFVKTLFGRRRSIPHLQSSDPTTRQLGERIAINTPIQGSAADLIKKAMVCIHGRMKQEGIEGKMILQVHDELVFEVSAMERERLEDLVRGEMEGVIQLRVPIKVEIGVGRNWRLAHP